MNKKIIRINYEETDLMRLIVDEGILQLQFDEVYKTWIERLIKLSQKITILRDSYTDHSHYLSTSVFFESSEVVMNQFLYFLVKDELSESTLNFQLPNLCSYIASDYPVEHSDDFNVESYITDLCRFKFNNILAAQFYDFYIGMWSAFEAAVNIMCENYSTSIKQTLENSKLKKFKKFINSKILSDSSISIESRNTITEAIDSNNNSFNRTFPTYVSFNDKINYLFKHVLKDYGRDINSDKDILLFCGALRNTVHNNGINKSSTKDVVVRNLEFTLNEGQALFMSDHRKTFILVDELIEIYKAMVNCQHIEN